MVKIFALKMCWEFRPKSTVDRSSWLIAAPLIVVTGGWVILPGLNVNGGVRDPRVPIDFDIIDVTVHKTDHVPGAADPGLGGGFPLMFMPGEGVEGRPLYDQHRPRGVLYRDQFSSGNARKLIGVGAYISRIESASLHVPDQ